MAAFRIPFRSLPPLGQRKRKGPEGRAETLTESIEQNAAGIRRRIRGAAARGGTVITFNFAAALLR